MQLPWAAIRYYSKILPGKYDPEVVPVMNLVHVQCYSVDQSVFVRRQQVNSQQVTGLTSKAKEEGFKVYI